MIAERIESAKLIENVQSFDFEKYILPIILNKNDIMLLYEKDNNKIIIGYNGINDTPELNIEIKDFFTKKTYHVVSDTKLSNKYTIWCAPKDIIHKETNKLIFTFYERSKILDIEFDF